MNSVQPRFSLEIGQFLLFDKGCGDNFPVFYLIVDLGGKFLEKDGVLGGPGRDELVGLVVAVAVAVNPAVSCLVKRDKDPVVLLLDA